MNSRGQTLGVSIIAGIFIFIIGMMIINFVMPEVTTARTALNCADASSISDATKLLCLVVDTVVPYWILLVFSIMGGSIVSQLLIK